MSTRWKTAQKYEKSWWKLVIPTIDPEFYMAYAEELQIEMEGIIKIEENTRILEIGSGAAGILTYINTKFRYAIDPLAHFFASVEEFKGFRDKKVKYYQGKAETLPFEDDSFDLIIIDNVLDHCENINLVFGEMHRVLKNRGIIYLRLNIYAYWGKLLRWIVEKLRIDPGHPHTFSKKSLSDYFQRYNFKLHKTRGRGFLKTWVLEITSFKAKELIKALTFSTPNKTMFILEK